nr:uncharacterized protein LOC122763923 [Solea senegalensis]
MPRLKGHNRSSAAKKRMEKHLAAVVESAPQSSTSFVPPAPGPSRRGTGRRHRVSTWPVSTLTGRSHKVVIPAESPDKKFVLLVGDSHLRAIVDGIVEFPDEFLSFGAMSTPGACARELTIELVSAVLPRTPDLVCVLAPSNDLTASRTLDEAAVDFEKLLTSALSRWPKVFVLDFPPRRNVDLDLQELFRQEFHRVAARKGVRYYSIAEFFPLSRSDLWSWDGVHLSDGPGMGLLVDLLLFFSRQQLEMATVVEVEHSLPPVAPSPAPAPRPAPRVVVRGATRSPRPPHNPLDWTLVEPRRKRRCPSPQGGKVQLMECSIPLTPVWFSPPILEVMDHIRPGNLDWGEPTTSTKGPSGVKRHRSTPAPKKSRGNQEVELEEEWPELRRAVAEVPVEQPRRRIGSQRRRTRQQEGAAADVVEGMTGPSPASPVTTEDLPCSALHSSPDSIKGILCPGPYQVAI